MKDNKKIKLFSRFVRILVKGNKYLIAILFCIMLTIAGLDLIEPQITKTIIDNAIGLKNTNLLIKSILLYTLVIIISAILNIVLTYLESIMKKRVAIKLKNKSLKHLSKLSGNYYSNIKTGNIISILNSDIFNIENFGIEILLSIVIDIITAIATLIILINLQPDLLIIVLVIQLIIIVIQTKFSKELSNKTREIRQKDGDISNLIQEYVSNIMNIVISKSKQNFFKRYTKEQRILTNKCINLDLKIAKNTSEINVMSGLIIISIFGYGGLKIINNELSLGELISFQQYIGLLIMPCTRIVNSNTRIQQALVSAERIFELIDEPIEIQQNNVGKKIEKDDNCTIKFENVSFSYTKEYKNLDGINIVFKPYETTALVGSSGSGKSTIINLIFRMWDVDDGEIYINNVDIREYNLKNLRKNISIVTQDSLLFDDTIKNNILLNRKNIEENKFINLCNKLRINEFVDDLEDGFDTIIGENGVKLSGGQKQRLSIARALLGNEKIIIFDEATSALDNISQKIVLKTIKEFTKEKTVIFIAHRISTIVDADKIYVLENGKVIEEGNHIELLKNNKVYRKMFVQEDTIK